jgi:hypothetical protein
MSITETGALALTVDDQFGYNWKEEKVPQEGEEEENVQQEFKLMTSTPLTTDNLKIYSISSIYAQETPESDKKTSSLVLEVFDVQDGATKLNRSVKLMKTAEEKYTGSKNF